ncbi:MFS transporter, YQGE family, putative transporter [Paenibacillus sp. yr247]|uniref:MFS transporter n=1 Tax=Paenibacillus sp. yr247 TaxID=1761880 RepID=UPI000886030B|nr:MFS transporter [Paenibacillus sp. yr247]SDN25186.1 MFS transporter, YQGE family, putative transporter [Paenibacillus sp. yr247]
MNLRIRSWLQSRGNSLPHEKQLSREAVISLIIHSTFQFGASMSGVFLNLYLWRLTHSVVVNGIYSMIVFILTPIGFALGGWMIKKKDRMVSYRLGIMLIGLFYLSVIIAQERLVEYYVLFAIFNGLAAAFYWVGYLTLMYDVSNEENRIRYLAFNMIFFTAATLAGPALAGFIIRLKEGLSGYTIVFSIAFCMFLLAALISLKIKASSGHHRVYYLKLTGLILKKERDWLKALLGFFGMGLLQGTMLFLPNILLFKVMPREDIVGYLGVLYSSLSIVTGIFISKYAEAGKSRLYLLLSTLGYLIGVSFLLGSISVWSVVGFMILYSIFSPLQGNTMTGYYYGLIAKLPLRGELKVESVVVREFFLNVGRVISIICLISFGSNLDGGLIPWILMIASMTQIALVWSIKNH